MAKENILVFGASQHARCTLDIIEQVGKYNIVGIIDRERSTGEMVAGYPILGKIENLKSILENSSVNKGIVAIGDNFMRSKVVHEISQLAPGFSFVSAIHPSLIKGKNVEIGEGVVLKAGVVIDNDTKVGNHCYLAINVTFGHDSSMEDFSSLGPGAITGGNVKIGKNTFIGLGAKVIHDITIGEHTVVGAGSLVNKNIGDKKVVYGVPAKIVREREISNKYL